MILELLQIKKALAIWSRAWEESMGDLLHLESLSLSGDGVDAWDGVSGGMPVSWNGW